jgi:hypothetical protein
MRQIVAAQRYGSQGCIIRKFFPCMSPMILRLRIEEGFATGRYTDTLVRLPWGNVQADVRSPVSRGETHRHHTHDRD